MDDEDIKNLNNYYQEAMRLKLGYPDSLLTLAEVKKNKDDEIDWDNLEITKEIGKGKKLIDLEKLGIMPNSLADSLLLNVGDPIVEPPNRRIHLHHMEREMIKNFGRFFGIEDVRGYLTSGGSEGNFISMYWAKIFLIRSKMDELLELKEEISDLKDKREMIKLELNTKSDEEKGFGKLFKKLYNLEKKIISNKKKLAEINNPILLTTKHHTHYSIFKGAHMLNLVEPNEECGVDLKDMERIINDLLRKRTYLQLIFIGNLGSTVEGGIDDIPGVNDLMSRYAKKSNRLKFTIHIDGALYGPMLPILKPFGEMYNYLNGIGANSISLSLYKFFGIGPAPTGVILTTTKYIEESYDPSKPLVEYAGNVMDTTFSGCRSGFGVLMTYYLQSCLKMDKNRLTVQKIVDHNIKMTNYFVSRLKEIFPEKEIRSKMFNVTFPRPSLKLLRKHQIMLAANNRASCIIQVSVSKETIDLFIDSLKEEVEENKKQNINFAEEISNVGKPEKSHTQKLAEESAKIAENAEKNKNTFSAVNPFENFGSKQIGIANPTIAISLNPQQLLFWKIGKDFYNLKNSLVKKSFAIVRKIFKK